MVVATPPPTAPSPTNAPLPALLDYDRRRRRCGRITDDATADPGAEG